MTNSKDQRKKRANENFLLSNEFFNNSNPMGFGALAIKVNPPPTILPLTNKTRVSPLKLRTKDPK